MVLPQAVRKVGEMDYSQVDKKDHLTAAMRASWRVDGLVWS